MSRTRSDKGNARYRRRATPIDFKERARIVYWLRHSDELANDEIAPVFALIRRIAHEEKIHDRLRIWRKDAQN